MSNKPVLKRGRPILATPAEVLKHQNRLKFSDEDMATELAVTVAEVGGYKSGAAEMPDTVKERFVALKRKVTRTNKPRKSKEVIE